MDEHSKVSPLIFEIKFIFSLLIFSPKNVLTTEEFIHVDFVDVTLFVVKAELFVFAGPKNNVLEDQDNGNAHDQGENKEISRKNPR